MTKNFVRVTHLLIALCLFDFSVFSHNQKQVETNFGTGRVKAWDKIKHVVMIVFENTSYTEAHKQPFMKSLKKLGATFEQYHAVTHPSQPNYIALIAGDTLGVNSDNEYVLNHSHLGDVLEQANKTWKVYAQDFPGNCNLEGRVGNYARKHVPFLSFSNITNSPQRCSNIVSESQFIADIENNKLPNFSMFIPNMLNNAHDTDISYADNWFKGAFEKYFTDPKYLQDTLFIVTFDEDDRFHFNRIYTVFIGAGVNVGFSSKSNYNHYNLLRTIEDIFMLDDLGRNDLFSEPIEDVWQL